jgi:hypothetical protein
MREKRMAVVKLWILDGVVSTHCAQKSILIVPNATYLTVMLGAFVLTIITLCAIMLRHVVAYVAPQHSNKTTLSRVTLNKTVVTLNRIKYN